MKKQLFTILALMVFLPSFAQYTTGTVTLTTGFSIKIDTDVNRATMTLTGPSNTWLGIGFGGNTLMPSVTDMFIWSDSPRRDYTSSGYGTPLADAVQDWTIVSDNAPSTTRTIVATRPLISTGDFTISNSSTAIPIIYALSTSTTFEKHRGSTGGKSLTRTALGVEDFSLNTAAIYPNPSNGNFKIDSKSPLTKLSVYTQSGTFVKTIELDGNSNSEEINLKDVASGVYLIELQSDSDKAWKKIIIQ